MPRLHDLAFWRELKGRVADPDPQMRAPTSGEVRTSDDRIVVYQSRPLPDRRHPDRLRRRHRHPRPAGALADRSAALAEAERLKLRLRRQRVVRAAHAADHDHQLFRAAGARRGHFRARPQPTSPPSAPPPPSWPARSTTCWTWPRSTPARWRWRSRTSASPTCLLNAQERALKDAQLGAVTLAVECEEDVGLIRGDAKRLAQTLAHLVDNALRQTRPAAA
ncbi:hypothetical protein ACRAWD_12110 [Caulobacter segnis]